MKPIAFDSRSTPLVGVAVRAFGREAIYDGRYSLLRRED